jgi:uncharacterized protein involved in outer membrane biogenesis
MRWKRTLIVLTGVVLVGGLGLLLWARAVLAGDGVRTAVEAQLTGALGQPVTIGGVHATIFPRVTMNLTDVAIGQPARIVIGRLHVGTDFRALLSRRIEHAAVRLSEARVELPLPAFAFMEAPPDAAPASTGALVTIVSIDSIELTGVEIVSGGRVLHGSVDVVPMGRGLTVRRVSLTAEGTSLDVTGAITDLAGPTGELAIKATGLNVLDLLAFVSDFSTGAEVPDGRASPAPPDAVPMNLLVSVDTDRATVGTVTLGALAGRAQLTPGRVVLEPVSFAVFGGTYSGTLTSTLDDTPEFHLEASVAGIDVTQVAKLAGSRDAITGRLAGTIDLTGRGTSPDRVIPSLAGTSRVTITNGTVAGLGLVRGLVLATSMRADGRPSLSGASTSAPEPFSSLGATVTVANGQVSTDDLQFTSKDVLLKGVGLLGLRDLTVDVAGRLQLSEELSKQAGRDLARYTQEQGRVIVPIRVTGTAGRLKVSVDVGEAAKRAVANRASEEAKKALGKALGRIIKK